MVVYTWKLFTGSRLFPPTLLRVLRAMRIFPLGKALRRMPSVMRLLETLIYSLPAFANVFAVVCLVIFIYALLGMSFFGALPLDRGEYLTRHANFKNFGVAVLTLFRMMTGESWNGIMHDVMDISGWYISCVYFVSFQLIGVYLLFNLLIAIVLDRFSDVSKADSFPVNPKMLADFADVWAIYDNKGTYFIDYTELPFVLMQLDPPLGFQGAHITEEGVQNYVQKQMKVPVNQEGKVHFCEAIAAVCRSLYGEEEIDQIQQAGMQVVAKALATKYPSLYREQLEPQELWAVITLQRRIKYYLMKVREKKKTIGEEAYHMELLERHRQIRLQSLTKCDTAKEAEQEEIHWYNAFVDHVRKGVVASTEEEEDVHVEADEELVSMINEKVPMLFRRYDVDNSGTINTIDELQQLSINCAFVLGLSVRGEDIQAHVAAVSAEFSRGANWELDDFKAWLCATVVGKSCGVRVNPTLLGLTKTPISPCGDLFRQYEGHTEGPVHRS